MTSIEKANNLLVDLHVKYIQSLDTKKDDLEYWFTEHLRLSGVYWGLTALDLLKNVNMLNREDVVKYVVSCGFGGHIGHDPHLTHTLYAVQILVIEDALDSVNTEKIIEYVKSRQDPQTGAFTGDEWEEIDTRFSYCAISCLSLLKRLDAIDVKKAIEFIMLCKNFDGGFGNTPGAESHAVFCCVGALAIVNSLHLVDADLLGWWLCERQLKNGGLNGRPEKLEDDPESGGIADRPGDMVDVFHTLFGIAGLSLLGYPDLKSVDPVYCLPKYVVQRIGLAERYHV
ncbi:7269_t:CDS:2 [Diversispora eburnea]|uniref:Geranylgeranyl transferase type-2 subunit beta n=1 Tax=Diversispora eburnea TaxID=1213867 RepID=A0A9N8V2N8_9GLOM|nr:7269_t:CDS:2 [Diversispora eburnea]